MSEYYRFKITQDKQTNAYSGYCRQTREILTAGTKHELWDNIRGSEKYDVNRHFRRNGGWIAVKKDTDSGKVSTKDKV
jgi:hypothetical protein